MADKLRVIHVDSVQAQLEGLKLRLESDYHVKVVGQYSQPKDLIAALIAEPSLFESFDAVVCAMNSYKEPDNTGYYVAEKLWGSGKGVVIVSQGAISYVHQSALPVGALVSQKGDVNDIAAAINTSCGISIKHQGYVLSEVDQLRAVILEDNDDVRDRCARVAIDKGYRVIGKFNHYRKFDDFYLNEKDFDLLITNAGSSSEGINLVNNMQRNGHIIPTVVVSVNGAKVLDISSKASEYVQFIQKGDGRMKGQEEQIAAAIETSIEKIVKGAGRNEARDVELKPKTKGFSFLKWLKLSPDIDGPSIK